LLFLALLGEAGEGIGGWLFGILQSSRDPWSNKAMKKLLATLSRCGSGRRRRRRRVRRVDRAQYGKRSCRTSCPKRHFNTYVYLFAFNSILESLRRPLPLTQDNPQTHRHRHTHYKLPPLYQLPLSSLLSLPPPFPRTLPVLLSHCYWYSRSAWIEINSQSFRRLDRIEIFGQKCTSKQHPVH
jgi:hypothetical protein